MAKEGKRQMKTLVCTECKRETIEYLEMYKILRNVLKLVSIVQIVENILHIRKRNKISLLLIFNFI